MKKKNASRVTETADHLNSWRRDEVIVQKAREMSRACRSVFTILSAFISYFFGRKMSSDLQDIVGRVVENLSNIQPANSAATSSSEGYQNFTNETEVQELNRCFQVPRLPAPNSSVLQQSSGRDLAAGFSSRQNYSSARQPRMRRQVPRSSSGRFQPYARNCSRGGNRDVVEPPSYFKDVCVLPNPSWERVPRGKMKVFCINKNMYVDAWEVKKDWDEVTLRGEIRKLFSSILKDERGEEIG